MKFVIKKQCSEATIHLITPEDVHTYYNYGMITGWFDSTSEDTPANYTPRIKECLKRCPIHWTWGIEEGDLEAIKQYEILFGAEVVYK